MVQTQINEIGNETEESSCDINKCTDSDYVTDEDKSKDISAELHLNNKVEINEANRHHSKN